MMLSTSVALCLTVPSESLSRDFKLAPTPAVDTFTLMRHYIMGHTHKF